jgi:hypothetical protein
MTKHCCKRHSDDYSSNDEQSDHSSGSYCKKCDHYKRRHEQKKNECSRKTKVCDRCRQIDYSSSDDSDEEFSSDYNKRCCCKKCNKPKKCSYCKKSKSESKRSESTPKIKLCEEGKDKQSGKCILISIN